MSQIKQTVRKFLLFFWLVFYPVPKTHCLRLIPLGRKTYLAQRLKCLISSKTTLTDRLPNNIYPGNPLVQSSPNTKLAIVKSLWHLTGLVEQWKGWVRNDW
jgi:hypothetical protein